MWRGVGGRNQFSPWRRPIGKKLYQKVASVALAQFEEAFDIVKQEEPIDYYHLLAIVEGQAQKETWRERWRRSISLRSRP